jgi:peroxiredoxin
MLKPGDPAPEIPGLAALRGKRVVLFFYPKADTPG